ncbi:hypothetical protein DINM_001550 [Dirofilaria immitis]|nr:hypothetical protein [Dirofilaria immitis]
MNSAKAVISTIWQNKFQGPAPKIEIKRESCIYTSPGLSPRWSRHSAYHSYDVLRTAKTDFKYELLSGTKVTQARCGLPKLLASITRSPGAIIPSNQLIQHWPINQSLTSSSPSATCYGSCGSGWRMCWPDVVFMR